MSGRRTAGALVLPLARACHPEPTVAVTAVFTAFAAAAGRGVGTVGVAAAVLAGQLSVGWCNDYVDRDRDRRSGRIDKPIPAGAVAVRTVWIAAFVALAAAVPLSLLSGWRAALAHLAGVTAAWGYNLGLKATITSPLPYAVGFAGLPAFVVLGLPGHPMPPVWLLVAGASLGVGAHFANVLPDLDDDRVAGVVGLPHRIGAHASLGAAIGFLLAASGLLVAGPGASGTAIVALIGGLAMGAVVLALLGGRLASRRPGSRAPFRVVLLVAIADAAVLIVRAHGL